MTHETKFVTIPQSDTVSGILQLDRATDMLILVPVVTSCTLLIQANHNTTSAGFVRTMAEGGSANLSFNVGAGSRALFSRGIGGVPPLARLETSVPQTDVRTFAVMVRY